MKAMKATASNVSKLLSGEPHLFLKSELHTTAIRGWKNRSSGFRVSRVEGGCVVEYRSSSWGREEEASLRNLEKYKAALETRFVVEIDRENLRLVVTEKDVQ